MALLTSAPCFWLECSQNDTLSAPPADNRPQAVASLYVMKLLYICLPEPSEKCSCLLAGNISTTMDIVVPTACCNLDGFQLPMLRITNCSSCDILQGVHLFFVVFVASVPGQMVASPLVC